MMPWPKSVEVVQRLASIQKREMLAVVNGDRDTMITLRLLWVGEYARAVGVARGVQSTGEQAMKALAKHVPGGEAGWWKRDAKRPLRLVVQRNEYRVQIGYGPGAVWYREELSCGHKLNLPASLDGEKPPKRRRCGQCGKEANNGTGNVRGVGTAMVGGVGA